MHGWPPDNISRAIDRMTRRYCFWHYYYRTDANGHQCRRFGVSSKAESIVKWLLYGWDMMLTEEAHWQVCGSDRKWKSGECLREIIPFDEPSMRIFRHLVAAVGVIAN